MGETWRALGDWRESRAEAERDAALVRRLVKYATARIRITTTTSSYGRQYWRAESTR